MLVAIYDVGYWLWEQGATTIKPFWSHWTSLRPPGKPLNTDLMIIHHSSTFLRVLWHTAWKTWCNWPKYIENSNDMTKTPIKAGATKRSTTSLYLWTESYTLQEPSSIILQTKQYDIKTNKNDQTRKRMKKVRNHSFQSITAMSTLATIDKWRSPVNGCIHQNGHEEEGHALRSQLVGSVEVSRCWRNQTMAKHNTLVFSVSLVCLFKELLRCNPPTSSISFLILAVSGTSTVARDHFQPLSILLRCRKTVQPRKHLHHKVQERFTFQRF